MFLKYSAANKILRFNVLRGYQLAPRDIPSMKANPYFTLAIHPKWYNQGPFQSSPEYGNNFMLRSINLTRYNNNN